MADNLRYGLDFTFMPGLLQRQGPGLLMELLTEREEFICRIFNLFYNYMAVQDGTGRPKRHFTPDEFEVITRDLSGGRGIIYVTLPEDPDGAMVYCTAYAFLCVKDGRKITDPVMYTIERSVMNTTCIGRMKGGTHYNLGPATGTVEGDIEFIDKLRS